jgi:hypothetical protein
LLYLLLVSPAAIAAPPDELAGLFVQACLPFAGRPQALRQWAARAGLPGVPDPARTAFLHGAPGKVFDASNDQGKFALLSSDDGLCAAVTDHAADQQTISAFEQLLSAAGVRFQLVAERDDQVNPKLHQREYLAAREKARWRILAATVRDREPGQAMLTAGPE